MHANTMRIVGDLRDRVLESRRSLEHEVTERLTAAVAAAERALAAARDRQAAGHAAVAAEHARLSELRRGLEALDDGETP